MQSAPGRGESATSLGEQEKVRDESDAVLLQSAEGPGDEDAVLLLFVAVPDRWEKDLGGQETVLVQSAQARGRQQKARVESATVLVPSAEDPGRQQKEGGKKPESVSQPSHVEVATVHIEVATINVQFSTITSKQVQVNPNKSIHRSLAILKLPKVVGQIITFAQTVVTAMTNNPKFPSPSPALSLVTATITALAAAEVAALTRVKGATTARNDKKAALVALLQQLRTYVQTVADADPENSASIIQSAGFVVKKTPVHKPRIFEVLQGAASGTAKVVCPTAGHRASYDWSYSTDGGKTWVVLPSTLQAKTSITGLAQGTTLQVRYRAVTKSGVADWSQPQSLFMK